MARPPKSVVVLRTERKSHRTKAELEQRERGECGLLTGVKIKEKEYVKSDLVAHKEFMRLQKLLSVIEKNDALQENILNRYCQIYAECLSFEKKRESFFVSLSKLEEECQEKIDSGEVTWIECMKLRANYQTQIINIDKQIQAKREMLLKIEKENLMTIASALRAVPKKAPDEDESHGGMFG